MAIYTTAIMDFSASTAIRSQYQTGTTPIVQPYIDAGYCLNEFPTWTPPLPDGQYPAPSGQYQNQRTWTDLTQAQNCASQVNAWLDANPACKAFNTTGSQVVQN